MSSLEFTEQLRGVLGDAREEASRLKHQHVGTEHLLLALLADRTPEEGGGPARAAALIKALGADPDQMRRVLEETVLAGPARDASEPLAYTSRAKAVLELAMTEARVLKAGAVGTEHLLLGLIREERGLAAQVLLDFGMTVDRVRGALARSA